MAEELLKFHLPYRYYQSRPSTNNMSRVGMKKVLHKAFGLTGGQCDALMASRNGYGFDIVCTPAQFGYFIMYRNDLNEGINGIKDLKVKPYQAPDLYGDISRTTGVDRNSVKKVLLAACYTPECCSDTQLHGISGIDVSSVELRSSAKHLNFMYK